MAAKKTSASRLRADARTRAAKAARAASRARGKAPRRACPWTPDELRILAWDWGSASPLSIAKKLGRTLQGVIRMAEKRKLGPQGQGTITMKDLIRKTGYHESRLHRTLDKLGIVPKRIRRETGRSAPAKALRMALREKDVNRVLAQLAKEPDRLPSRTGPRIAGLWGVGGHPPACVDPSCGRTDQPHHGEGLCHRCWARAYWRRRYGREQRAA